MTRGAFRVSFRHRRFRRTAGRSHRSHQGPIDCTRAAAAIYGVFVQSMVIAVQSMERRAIYGRRSLPTDRQAASSKDRCLGHSTAPVIPDKRPGKSRSPLRAIPQHGPWQKNGGPPFFSRPGAKKVARRRSIQANSLCPKALLRRRENGAFGLRKKRQLDEAASPRDGWSGLGKLRGSRAGQG